jgi:hypothetical protein
MKFTWDELACIEAAERALIAARVGKNRVSSQIFEAVAKNELFKLREELKRSDLS